MPALMILPLVYVAALGWLLWVAHKNKKLYAWAKTLCSSLFLVCALVAGWVGGAVSRPGFALLMAALVLCAFGDVFLGVANQRATKPNRRPFMAGVASFTLAHLLFCVLFYSASPFHWYDLALPVVIVAIMYVLEKRDFVRLKKMRPVGYAYAFLMALMASKALQLPALGGVASLLLCAGAVLFMVSDIVLLFLYFGVRRKPWMRTANLLTYYTGIYLIACGAYWF